MVSKVLAIELIKELYKSAEGLLPYTLYTRFKMNAIDVLAFVKQYQPRNLISVDDELRIRLTDDGRRYALSIINKNNRELAKIYSDYYNQIKAPQLGKYDPYIPDKSFAEKYNQGKGGEQKLAVRSEVAPL
jgi:hypothetical protein